MADEPDQASELDRQALRLALAFFCILEPDRRQQVLDLAQEFADANALAKSERS